MDPGVIAVIGTTGVGKSNLSIQLAKELNGEVINADALQVYKGLDIITNKMPVEEREGVTHHLMDFLPMDREYSVLDFKADALELIKTIHGRKRMPIVVGGTHYYIQSLLWRDTLLDTKKDVGTHSKTQPKEQNNANDAFLRDSDTLTLYKKLQEVDPVMANKWHENDRRKITRSLQGGLFEEIKGMRKNVGSDTDYERGIWQAIGYKEFDPYFTALEDAIKNDQPTDSKGLEALKAECTETMKIKTRQYAKRQVLWIRNKLLPLCREKDVKVFLLDATSLDTWKESVGDVAVKIAKDFFAGNSLPDPSSLNSYAKEMLVAQRDLDVVAALESWEKKECDICTEMQRIMHDKYDPQGSTDPLPPVIVHGPTSWEQHLRSKQHRRMKTNKTEMERDGVNWWYFRAQEYKKRKREGTLNSAAEVVGEHEGEASPTKVRRTSNDEDETRTGE
ncbi:hypothetical protein BGZ80_011091 [Entomortierella chlamydospora]|uniref:tRNA dimethylallyltransferase n=1 Tax=Entomortierella chlamydospora TaxID=101097 RepID=A0A9P6T3T3_9FUNG|nr:hypothetical protein BGZ79_006724 [Entomortierella chlamydospora]KAG0022810.1 hypothetical protein BGZ80_011091 [Entomortierella chlamydospora]